LRVRVPLRSKRCACRFLFSRQANATPSFPFFRAESSFSFSSYARDRRQEIVLLPPTKNLLSKNCIFSEIAWYLPPLSFGEIVALLPLSFLKRAPALSIQLAHNDKGHSVGAEIRSPPPAAETFPSILSRVEQKAFRYLFTSIASSDLPFFSRRFFLARSASTR